MLDTNDHNDKVCTGFEPTILFSTEELWCGVGDKANCLKIGPRLIGGMPSVGVFLRDPSPYLREFRRKTRKTPNG